MNIIQALTHGTIKTQQGAIRWYQACEQFLNDPDIQPLTKELTWHHLANRYHQDFLPHFPNEDVLYTYPLWVTHDDKNMQAKMTTTIDLGDGPIQIEIEEEDPDHKWNRENNLSKTAAHKLSLARSNNPIVEPVNALENEIKEISEGFGMNTDQYELEEYLKSVGSSLT